MDLIKRFEGFQPVAYRCPAGKLTIGYGHTGDDVRIGQKITRSVAEWLLKKDVKGAETDVKNLVKVKLTQYQFDALVSWTYNLGATTLNDSTMLRLLNKGDYGAVPCQMMRYIYAAKKPLDGLKRRRRAEGQLFNNGKSFHC